MPIMPMKDTDFYCPGTDHKQEFVIIKGDGQKGLRDRALLYVKKWRTCLDIGSDVGMWTRFLQREFDNVVCFEPNPIFTKCWHKNIGSKTNAVLHEVGLSNKTHNVSYKKSSTQQLSRNDVEGDIKLHTLDSYKLKDVDFIKIDVDGYEDRVLEGAVETITRNKPVINIEMKTAKRKQICVESAKILHGLGYTRRERNRSDEVWLDTNIGGRTIR